ncbi:MAG: HipA domain-containing protein [Clostridia bacterium]|nr:HipA domain-containing protein [Clostridia bacterium]MBQ6427123.1 HipA domain-containing protein [Clostridia bacterium]
MQGPITAICLTCRADHSNNFTFLFDGGQWRLAPAYDLTYSSSMGGEHATSVAGEGRYPSMKDILSVAKKAGIRESDAKETAVSVENTVKERLSRYL